MPLHINIPASTNSQLQNNFDFCFHRLHNNAEDNCHSGPKVCFCSSAAKQRTCDDSNIVEHYVQLNDNDCDPEHGLSKVAAGYPDRFISDAEALLKKQKLRTHFRNAFRPSELTISSIGSPNLQCGNSRHDIAGDN